MLLIVNLIAPIFLIILLAALAGRYFRLSSKWQEVLNLYALHVGFPALLFDSLSKLESFSGYGSLVVINSLFVLIVIFVTYFLGRAIKLNSSDHKTLIICLAFSNVAYLGIPVLNQLYGSDILPAASLLVAVYVFWIFSVGILFLEFTGKEKKTVVSVVKNLLRNPLLISILLGLIVGFLNIKLPQFVATSVKMVSLSATPIVLIVIGLFIGSAKMGKIRDWVSIFFFSIGTLVILPGILYFILRHLNMSQSDLAVTIIDAAMPLAITPFALADKYKLNKNFIARSIVLSTIISVITLPIWISVLRNI